MPPTFVFLRLSMFVPFRYPLVRDTLQPGRLQVIPAKQNDSGHLVKWYSKFHIAHLGVSWCNLFKGSIRKTSGPKVSPHG